jgi:hypothetical protein
MENLSVLMVAEFLERDTVYSGIIAPVVSVIVMMVAAGFLRRRRIKNYTASHARRQP